MRVFRTLDSCGVLIAKGLPKTSHPAVNQVEHIRHCQSGDRGYEESLLTWTSEWDISETILVTFFIHLSRDHLFAVSKRVSMTRLVMVMVLEDESGLLAYMDR